VTWCDCTIDGSTAFIQGQHHDLRLTIEHPQGVHFVLEQLEEQCKENKKPGVLRRLSIVLPLTMEVDVRIRMKLLNKS